MADHLSIGEVLALLQSDFPEVTISKIRFLESQGLIDPERSPSGYRKFSERDIAVLEWILRQQRDNFLPLRVIRERIDRGDHEREIAGESDIETTLATDAAPSSQITPRSPRIFADAGLGRDATESRGATTDGGAGVEPAQELSPLAAELATLTLTAEELSNSSGLSPLELEELETYGLLHSRTLGPTTYYDGEALLVARAAKEFADYGVEPRHLRMLRTAAEREASVFEQAIMPVLQERGAEGQAKARAALERLAVLGERLRGAMMRAALDEHLR